MVGKTIFPGEVNLAAEVQGRAALEKLAIIA